MSKWKEIAEQASSYGDFIYPNSNYIISIVLFA